MRPNLRQLAVVFFGGTLLAGVTGCGSRSTTTTASTPIPFEEPDVTVRDARLRGVGLLGGAIDIEMHLYNPNEYDLKSPRVSYNILLDGEKVARGVQNVDVIVPSGDSAVVRLPASFGYGSVGRAGRALLNHGAIGYRVLGRITVGTPYGRLWFPYDRAGQLSTMTATIPH